MDALFLFDNPEFFSFLPARASNFIDDFGAQTKYPHKQGDMCLKQSLPH